MWRWRLSSVALMVLATGCRQSEQIVVFHAASLSRVLGELAADFTARDGARVVLQPSGSQVAARKLSELNLRADLVAVADARVIEEILFPAHAGWLLVPATNELVIVHGAHSRFTEEITADNWFEILLRPEVKVGLANRDLAPLGYLSLQLLQLAEAHHRARPEAVGLADRLPAKVAPEHLMPDENELLALLATRAVDYAIMFRSTAEDHHLKLVRLPAAYNLGDPSHADGYARAAVPVRMKSGAAVVMRGAPIAYGLTIPRQAPNAAGAVRFVTTLLDERGRATWRRRGFSPVTPPVLRGGESPPPALAASAGGEATR